jgi:hypothetical protein
MKPFGEPAVERALGDVPALGGSLFDGFAERIKHSGSLFEPQRIDILLQGLSRNGFYRTEKIRAVDACRFDYPTYIQIGFGEVPSVKQELPETVKNIAVPSRPFHLFYFFLHNYYNFRRQKSK